jgi:L-fuconate dehydratase
MQMLYQLSYAPNDRERFRCSGSDSSSSEDSASNECNPRVVARLGRSGPEAGQLWRAAMSARFTSLETFDVRFPTSRERDGSDAMNPDPDYSAAYCILRTDDPAGHAGHGFAFTIGRGNDVEVAAIAALSPYVIGRTVAEICDDLGGFFRQLTHDSQLRWLGPEKGVMQMAIAAVVNAAWDLAAKRAGVPLWKLLADMSPEALVELVDFRYLSDALTPAEALAILERNRPGRAAREREMRADGFPAYTTSAGWLGYDDEKVRSRVREALADGFRHIKLKVGKDLDDDIRRCRIARAEMGPEPKLMVDANQTWDRDSAIAAIGRLAQFDLFWVEEPTNPDDILAHAAIAQAVAPIAVATGEHAANRVTFKQLLQLGAIGFCQIDAVRSGGVNDTLATLLLAAKFGVPVCPHAGGVGLCELVQHLAIFDYIAVGASLENRVLEFVDHLHEHFVDPVRVRRARYVAPLAPGFSSAMHPESIAAYTFPGGQAWRDGAPPSAAGAAAARAR